MDMVYSCDFRVSVMDTDENGNLHHGALLRFMQEAATEHLASFCNIRELLSRNAVFILTRLCAEISQPQGCASTLTVLTWHKSTKPPFFYRDYVVLSGGTQIARAVSQWVIYDFDEGAMIRRDPKFAEFDNFVHNNDCGLQFMQKNLHQTAALGLRTIYKSDLDINGHMNNSRYADIARDFCPDSRIAKILDISYAKQCAAGDILEISGGGDNTGCTICGAQGDKRVFTAQILF